MEEHNEHLVSVGTEVQDQAGLYADQFVDNGHLAGHAIRAYGSQMNGRREEEMILQYLPLVHRIVSQVTGYLKPPLSREDLISAGTIGLVKAARDFDPTKDAEFKTYAYIRIRGAVVDELRSWSFAPPSVKKLIDQAQRISERMMNERGSGPTDEELAREMGLDSDKLYQVFETARARHFLSMNGMDDEAPALGQILASGGLQPDCGVEHEELKQELIHAIHELPEKYRQILILYYQRELTMKQIAEVMEVTESRISQLHAAALFKLSVRLKKWDDVQQ